MKKMKIGRTIRDVIDEKEFIRRTNTNPDLVNALADDTAVVKDGYVYPVNRVFSNNVMGVTDYGPILRYSKPNDIDITEYEAKNIIDFDNIQGFEDAIEKQAQLDNAERSILMNSENIFSPIPKETDVPEMAAFKQFVTQKHIDLDSYKGRFGSNFNNDKNTFEAPNITFFKLKRLCNALDMKCYLTFEDVPGCPNPAGVKITTCITDSVEGDE